MPVYFQDGSILIISSAIGMAEACCCVECVLLTWDPCNDYFEADVRGVAGLQPRIKVTITGVESNGAVPGVTRGTTGCEEFFNGVYVLDPCEEIVKTGTVTYELGGLFPPGSFLTEPVALNLDYQIDAFQPPSASKTLGYLFVDFYSDPAGSGRGTKFSYRCEYYAKLTDNPLTFIYEADGASCDDKSNTSRPAEVVLPFDAPTRPYPPCQFAVQDEDLCLFSGASITIEDLGPTRDPHPAQSSYLRPSAFETFLRPASSDIYLRP